MSFSDLFDAVNAQIVCLNDLEADAPGLDSLRAALHGGRDLKPAEFFKRAAKLSSEDLPEARRHERSARKAADELATMRMLMRRIGAKKSLITFAEKIEDVLRAHAGATPEGIMAAVLGEIDQGSRRQDASDAFKRDASMARAADFAATLRATTQKPEALRKVIEEQMADPAFGDDEWSAVVREVMGVRVESRDEALRVLKDWTTLFTKLEPFDDFDRRRRPAVA